MSGLLRNIDYRVNTSTIEILAIIGGQDTEDWGKYSLLNSQKLQRPFLTNFTTGTFGVILNQFYTTNGTSVMAIRQSISINEPNAEWLKFQVESQEYSSHSEVINDLIRQRRKADEADLVRTQTLLMQAEQRIHHEGYSELSVSDIKNNVLKQNINNGNL